MHLVDFGFQANDCISDSVLTYLEYFFFFFQAEDGIRDSSVTGVQTCALPISPAVTPGTTFTSEGGRGARASAHDAKLLGNVTRVQRRATIFFEQRCWAFVKADRKSVV